MSSTTTPTPTSAAGRPRNAGLDHAIRAATRQLLSEVGYAGLSLQAVAERAGTSRPALYRRWDNKALLVLDAVFPSDDEALPDLGDLRAELAIALGGLAAQFNDPVARSAVGGLLAELQSDPGLHRKVRDELLAADHVRVSACFHRAIERGELPTGFDVATALDAAAGAVVYRTCFLGVDVTVDDVAALIDFTLLTRESPS